MENNKFYCDLSKNGNSCGMTSWQSQLYPEYTERNGEGGRFLPVNQADKRIYFRIEKEIENINTKTLALEVGYFDEGTGHFTVMYCSGGEMKYPYPVLTDNTGRRKKAVFYLINPEQRKLADENDFCIELNAPRYESSPCGVIFSEVRVLSVTETGNPPKITTSALAGNTFFKPEDIKFDISAEGGEACEMKLTVEDEYGNEIISENVRGNHCEFAPDITKYGCYVLKADCTCGNKFSHGEARFALSMYAGDGKNDFMGCCVHFTGRDSGAVAPLIKASGIGAIRDEFLWRDYEKEKGKFKFLPAWERYLGDAEKNGIEMFTILAFDNPLYHEGDTCMPKTDEELEAFGRYVFETVSHLGNRCNMYEVWNEPNLYSFSSDISPKTYIPVLKIACENIKKANPNAYIVGPGACGEALPWIERILQYGAGEYLDAISFHPYLYVKGPDDGEFEEKISGIKNLIEKYCPKLDMIISEFGWGVHSGGVTREMQAEYFVKSIAISAAEAKMKKFIMYEYQDSGMSLANMERNWGLVEYWENPTPYAAKPIFTATAAYNALIGDTRPYAVYKNDGIRAFFYSAGRERVVMIWTDGRKTVINTKPSETVYDINGNKTGNDGGTEIGEKPVYIVTEELITEKEISERIGGGKDD